MTLTLDAADPSAADAAEDFTYTIDLGRRHGGADGHRARARHRDAHLRRGRGATR